ncbi:hypothetical protein OSI32_23580, partial [Mycobacterium ulcerans]
NGVMGGAGVRGGDGGTGGLGGWLWGKAGAAGTGTPLPANEILMRVDQYGNPVVTISVGGGPGIAVTVRYRSQWPVGPASRRQSAVSGHPHRFGRRHLRQ